MSVSAIYATAEEGKTENYCSFISSVTFRNTLQTFTERRGLSASVSTGWKYKSYHSDVRMVCCNADGLATSVKVSCTGRNSNGGLRQGFRLGSRLTREVSTHLLVKQLCRTPRRHVALTAKFCTVAPNILGSSLRNLLHIIFLRRFLNFWEICAALCYSVVIFCRHFSLLRSRDGEFPLTPYLTL